MYFVLCVSVLVREYSILHRGICCAAQDYLYIQDIDQLFRTPFIIFTRSRETDLPPKIYQNLYRLSKGSFLVPPGSTSHDRTRMN